MTIACPKKVSLAELVEGHKGALKELKKWTLNPSHPKPFYCSKGKITLNAQGKTEVFPSFELSSFPDIAAEKAGKLEEGHFYEIIPLEKGKEDPYRIRELPLNYFDGLVSSA